MNVHFLDLNGEDGGNVGYWAFLPATHEHVLVWRIPDGSFYSIETMRWHLDHLPRRAELELRPRDRPAGRAGQGSGTVHGWITWTFTG